RCRSVTGVQTCALPIFKAVLQIIGGVNVQKINWGISSTAGIAQKELIPAFKRATNAKVTAIASSSGIEKAKAVADNFSIEKVYEIGRASWRRRGVSSRP